MSFQKFPSIEQYRDIIKEISSHVRYRGRDADNKPIYDNSYKLPTIDFSGTVKLHGTNAAVARRGQGELWAQSRNRVITTDNDNAGFCAFVMKRKQAFTELLNQVEGVKSDEIVSIFGEWCGQGIQRNVAIAELPKMFVIFAIKIGSGDQETWLPKEQVAKISNTENLIFNIYSFETFSITIDFENPEAMQETLEQLTDRVERQCPVGHDFGVQGIGEGIVWTAHYNGQVYRFKVKGEEHAVSKTKHSAATKPEVQGSLDDFVKNVVTKQRCEQGIQEVFTSQNKTVELSETGSFIRWVVADVMKEESDTIVASNLKKDTVTKAVTDAARTWFKKYSMV